MYICLISFIFYSQNVSSCQYISTIGMDGFFFVLFKMVWIHKKKALFIVIGLGIKLMHQLIFDGPYHASGCLCYYHFHSCNAHSQYIYMCMPRAECMIVSMFQCNIQTVNIKKKRHQQKKKKMCSRYFSRYT